MTDGRGRPVRDGGLGRWLARVAPATAHGEVAIALVTDARMRVLNRTFRGVDTPTDVLSFPAEGSGPRASRRKAQASNLRPLSPGPKPQDSSPQLQAPSHLGDLAIALPVARRQARAEGHDLATELRILALHGVLHLLGYDHERDRGTMRTVEDRLRRRAGLPAGLITRTPKRPLLK